MSYYTVGLNLRHLALSPYTQKEYAQTPEKAIAAHEQEYKVTLNRQERREFFEGWRKGEVDYYKERVFSWVRYMNKAEVAFLAARLKALSEDVNRMMREGDEDDAAEN